MVQNQNSIHEIKLVRLELIEPNLIPQLFSSCLLTNIVTSNSRVCWYLSTQFNFFESVL